MNEEIIRAIEIKEKLDVLIAEATSISVDLHNEITDKLKEEKEEEKQPYPVDTIGWAWNGNGKNPKTNIRFFKCYLGDMPHYICFTSGSAGGEHYDTADTCCWDNFEPIEQHKKIGCFDCEEDADTFFCRKCFANHLNACKSKKIGIKLWFTRRRNGTLLRRRNGTLFMYHSMSDRPIDLEDKDITDSEILALTWEDDPICREV